MALGKKTGGRQKGSVNKATARKAAIVAESGLTPLDYMLSVMREDIPKDASIETKIAMTSHKMDAAKAAAPYVHPKLATTEITGKDGGPVTLLFTSNDEDI